MAAFFIGLQFLTRIRIVTQTEWTAENFGKSVKYFTLVGAVLGSALAALAALLYAVLPGCGIYPPQHFAALCLIAAGFLLTGGLHCDGFMDTLDGLFSGRSRARMLEIMKDSRVGANGVVGFGLLLCAKWALVLDMPPERLGAALFLAPVLGRLAMTLGITCFPYARPEGIGKAFAQYANRRSFAFAAAVALLFTAALAFWLHTAVPLVAAALVLLFAAAFSRYATRALGGLTGDVYGAITELSEVLTLLVFAWT